MLAWLVRGAQAWYAGEGAVAEVPASIEASTEAWRGESDSLGDWLGENFEGSGHMSDIVLLSNLRTDFQRHQAVNGEKEWGPRLFTQRLRGHKWVLANGVAFDPSRKERVPGMAGPQRVLRGLRKKMP